MLLFFIGLCILFAISYYTFILYLSTGFNKQKTTKSNTVFTVSVLIPCHNEAKTLPSLLKCLEKQSYPSEKIEYLFINDRSTDQTQDILSSFTDSHSNAKLINIESTPENHAPKKWALLQGIQSASGEIIITTDADTQPNPEWIESLVSFFEKDTGMVLANAAYRTDIPFHSIFHQFLALEYFTLGAVSASSAILGFPITCNGANLAYRKQAFLDAEGFGESIQQLSGDDDLLMHRIQEMTSWKIRYALTPKASVPTDPPHTFSHFIRQRIRFSSKHIAYPLNLKILLSGVYGYYFLMCLQLVLSFFHPWIRMAFAGQLIFKAIFELCFLSKAKNVLDNRPLLKWYPLAVIPHFFYIVIFPVLGNILKPRWK